MSLSSSASQASPWASPSVLVWSGVRDERAVVGAVGDRVVVVVGVAGVALGVAVGVGLARVHRQRAVVGAVGDRVAVVVEVLGVPAAVSVGVVARAGGAVARWTPFISADGEL